METKTKWTPGQWHVGALSEEVIGSRGQAIVSRPPDTQDEEVWQANAQLCATAPELYAELDTLAAALEDGDTVHIEPGSVKAARIRALLGKARGEVAA